MNSFIQEANTPRQVEIRFKIAAFFIFKGRKNNASKKYRRYCRMCYKIRREVDVEKAKQLADTYLSSLRPRQFKKNIIKKFYILNKVFCFN